MSGKPKPAPHVLDRLERKYSVRAVKRAKEVMDTWKRKRRRRKGDEAF